METIIQTRNEVRQDYGRPGGAMAANLISDRLPLEVCRIDNAAPAEAVDTAPAADDMPLDTPFDTQADEWQPISVAPVSLWQPDSAADNTRLAYY